MAPRKKYRSKPKRSRRKRSPKRSRRSKSQYPKKRKTKRSRRKRRRSRKMAFGSAYSPGLNSIMGNYRPGGPMNTFQQYTGMGDYQTLNHMDGIPMTYDLIFIQRSFKNLNLRYIIY